MVSCKISIWSCVLVTSYLVNAASGESYLESGEDPKLFCYYSSFAQNRKGVGKFIPENIDPGLCTHVIFAFSDLVKGTFLKPSSWNDLPNGKDKGLYARTQALKNKNPKIKVLLALGGWKIGSTPFIPMISDVRKRRLFVRNVVRYLRKHGFDGLDMDWEFPGTRGSGPNDKYKFTALMKELRTAFERESRQTGRERLLLTMAAAGGSYFIGLAYEPEKIVKYLDYILLMTYNYHGSWNDFTGHHSGLFSRADEAGGEREWNQAWTINYWLNKAGAPKEKIVVGIATYGMTFTLADPKDNGLKAAAVGGGNPGPYTGESGIMAYYEICQKLASGWNSVWIDEQKVPYAYSGSQWIGYDNLDSVTYKANYIRDNGLGGAFIWSVEMDDFRGVCGEGKYPLLSTIAQTLRQPRSRSTPRLLSPPMPVEVKEERIAPSGLPVSRNGPRFDQNQYPDIEEYSYNYDDDRYSAVSNSKPDLKYEDMLVGFNENGKELVDRNRYIDDVDDREPYPTSYDFKDESYLQNQNPSDVYDARIGSDVYDDKYDDETVLETGHSLVSTAALDRSRHNRPSRNFVGTLAKPQGRSSTDVYQPEPSYKPRRYDEQSPDSLVAFKAPPRYKENNPVYNEASQRSFDQKDSRQYAKQNQGLQRSRFDDRYDTPSRSRTSVGRSQKTNEYHKVNDNDVVYGQPQPKSREQIKNLLKDVDDVQISRLLSGPHSDNIIGLESQTYQRPQYNQPRRNQNSLQQSRRNRQFFKEGDNEVDEPHLSSNNDYLKYSSISNDDQYTLSEDPLILDKQQYPDNSRIASEKSSSATDLGVLQSWQYYTPGSTCDSPGLFPHPHSCKQYYICVRHGDRWYKFHLTCPKGLGFKPDRAVCDLVPSCLDE